MMTGWSFLWVLLWVCQAGSLVFLKYLTVGGFKHLLIIFPFPHGLNGFYKWELLSETGMILQVGSLQPRKHNSKTVHSKLPNCQINSIVSRKLNGSLKGPATVHYCRSGLSTKFFLVERLFTPNKILVPRLSYSPIVYICFFVGIHNISCCLTSSRLKSR